MKTKKQLQYPEYKYVLANIVENSNEFTLPSWLIVKELWSKTKFSDQPTRNKEISTKIIACSKKLIQSSKKDLIYYQFLQKDLKKLAQILKSKYPYTGNTRSLVKIGEKCLPVLAKEMGLNIKRKVNVFFVAEFPKPYNRIKTWDLMFADRNDERKYGIKEGIYVHKERQFPLFCEFLIIHEYVHFIVRSNSKRELSSGHKWIEEGLADWYSFIAHFRLFRSIDNLVFFKKVYQIYEKNFPRSPLAEYSQYDRAIKRLYLWGGHEAVKKLVSKYLQNPNSSRWSRLYRNILQEKSDIISVANTKRPGDRLNSYLLTLHEKVDTLNISAVEYLILNELNMKVQKCMPYKKIRYLLSIKEKVFDDAISRLEGCGLILKKENNVILNDTSSSLLDAGAIKPVYYGTK